MYLRLYVSGSYAELFIWGPQIKIGGVSSRGLEVVPLVRGSGERSPLKLKHFWLLHIQWLLQICYVF